LNPIGEAGMLRNWILKTADGLLGPPTCSALAAVAALRGKSKAPSGWKPGTPKRILIIRPGGIGDMLLLLPALSAISKTFPSAKLDIVCEQRNINVVELAQIESCCLPYDRNPVTFITRLLKTEYDIAIDSEQFHHSSAVFAALSGAPVRIGFNINPRRNGLYTHLIPYSPDSFEGTEFLRLLAPLGINEIQFHPASIRPDDPDKCIDPAVLEQLRSARRNGRRIIVIHSGGSVDRKQLGEDKMAALVARLAEQPESSVVVLGGKSDAKRTERILSKSYKGEKVIAINGGLNLKQCSALVSMCSIFVGPDSGLLHLAAACGIPTVAIFGPSDPRKWGYGGRGRHIVVRNEVPCAPCFIFGYSKPCSHYECIEGITVDDVARACNKVAASIA